MNQDYKDVRAAAQVQLARKIKNGGAGLRTEDIQEVVQRASIYMGCTEVDQGSLVADLESSFQTTIGAARALVGRDEGYEPWLPKKKAEINWAFWSRYESYLLQEQGWPQVSLDKLDEVSDQVLGLLTDPTRNGSWDRRGMVVGHVQSGKTANYVGLISKAADAGYKLIVVLAGFHKSLRTQTQIRLEEGFLGYDRNGANLGAGLSNITRIGVGLLDGAPKADSITTRADDGDFKRNVANSFAISPGGNPLLFVIKKNASVLENLLGWVRWAANAKDEQGQPYVKGVPLLVIDDEADQGSIDTKEGAVREDGEYDPEHNPTILNQRIRKLLHLFDQSAYVGYTATPFANIFIHEQARTDEFGEDLFPRSFIVSLPAPSNYVGPAQVFGLETEAGAVLPGLPIVRLVKDHAKSLDLREKLGWMPPVHKSHHVPQFNGLDEIPPSLGEAIRAFILVCAARLARGQDTAHNSMLVHVTRFTAAQNRVAEQIRGELHDLQRRIKFSDPELAEELQELWESDFEPTTAKVAAQYPDRPWTHEGWEQIAPRVKEAALSIKVREINGQAGEVLDYVKHEGTGLNVIAIGGDKLSRGLTLEGLSVSYFLRASRMYDTLMQMGRWFGYRPGYLDLCRLYTTPDLTDWYSHIAGASEELREDFNRMVASGGTPRDFGHRVKSHPAMLVTSQVKMRHGTTINVSFAGDISETINFWRSRGKLERNWNAVQQLVAGLEQTGIQPARVTDDTDTQPAGGWMYTGVPHTGVIDFLTGYQEHAASKKVKTKLLADYIRKEAESERLLEWTLLVASGSGSAQTIASISVPRVARSWFLTGDDLAEQEILKQQNHFRIRRLVSPTDESRDLTSEEYKRAFEATLTDWSDDPGDRKKPSRPSGPQIRRARPATRGLLILYLLDPGDTLEDKVEPDAGHLPIVGFAASFPYVHPDKASKVAYVVNNVYYRQEFGRPGYDDEDQE
ncbi:MAG TPA: Z1 domain-containing protein [Longimicrobium sp.]|jgi:hypothetical protein|uniref:Z1 domain-containing protein n=1 Tax=Longimicrobium sp. TaxID=2029185 RepID=UPI002ED96CEF